MLSRVHVQDAAPIPQAVQRITHRNFRVDVSRYGSRKTVREKQVGCVKKFTICVCVFWVREFARDFLFPQFVSRTKIVTR